MSKRRVGKLRKYLAVFFGMLSLFFAGIALKNKLQGTAEVGEDTRRTDTTCCRWGAETEATARCAGRLVFAVRGDADDFKPSKAARKTLADHYVSVCIPPKKYPADIAVIDHFFASAIGRKTAFKAGIFSPNLVPIYMTSKVETANGRVVPNLENAILGAAAQFEKNPTALKSKARTAARIADAPSDFAIPADIFAAGGRLGFFYSESARLFTYFSNPRTLGASPAELSENARLAFRIAETDIRQLAARAASLSALEMLCARIASPAETPTSRLLFLRALSESEYAAKNPKAARFFLHFAGRIADAPEQAQPFAPDKKPQVRDIALTVPILLRAYGFSGDNRYLKRAHAAGKILERAAASRGVMESVLGEKSEASALEYVLCARAFFELSKFGDAQNARNAVRVLDRLDELFMTPLGVWSINSKNSAFAKISRTVFTRDSELPSYVGEAAQLFAEDKNLKNRAAASVLKRLAAAAIATSPLESGQWGSLKLSLVPSFESPKMRAPEKSVAATDTLGR